jgi:hypothetical protein
MKAIYFILALVGVGAFAAIDFAFASDASLLVPILFWAAVVHGSIALAATADLAEGEWLAPVQPVLLKMWPLLYIFPVAFLIFARDISFYGWVDHQTAWLEPQFFVIRNVAILLLTAIAGHLFALAAGRKSKARGKLAVLYLLMFVTTHSMAAWDWVMPLEFPWISTMLGPLFFVGALYLGIAVAAIASALLYRKHPASYAAVLKDTATMVFGFALLWGGLFYGQYLTIWYASIPEEVAFFHERLATDLGEGLFALTILAHFAIPFVGLIPNKMRTTPLPVIAASLLVMLGYVGEKVFYIEPAASVGLLTALLGMVALGLPVLAVALAGLKELAEAPPIPPKSHH